MVTGHGGLFTVGGWCGDWTWRVIDCGMMRTRHGGLLTVGCGDWAWRAIDCGMW